MGKTKRLAAWHNMLPEDEDQQRHNEEWRRQKEYEEQAHAEVIDMSTSKDLQKRIEDTNDEQALPALPQAAGAPIKLESLDDVFRLGEVLAGSGLFADARDARKAVTKVLAGAELGLTPIASMTGIYVVKGKITLSANVVASQIKRHPRYDYRVAEMNDDAVEIHFFQDGEKIGESRFTRDDARKAGTQNMGKYPRNMMFARAMTNGARWYVPDVFNGPVYTPEEMGVPVDDEGEIDDAYWEEAEKQPSSQQQPQETGKLSVESLERIRTSLEETPPEDMPERLEKMQEYAEGLSSEAAQEQLAELAKPHRERVQITERFFAEVADAAPSGPEVANAVAKKWDDQLNSLPQEWQEYVRERYRALLDRPGRSGRARAA